MIAHEFLLRQSHANELAKEFSRCHGARLRQEMLAVRAEAGGRRQVDLYDWLRSVQFDASVTALMGEHVLEVYPTFGEDFAAFDRGFVFGLNSNAIPITGWVLMHLLDPRQPGLLARALAEMRPCAVLSADEAGHVVVESLDAQRLAAGPLLQSVLHETLRLYTDVLVTRDLLEDVRLPLGDDNKRVSARELLLRKGTRVVAPNIMNQWDPGYFVHPAPADVFCAERFLVPANTTGDAEKAGSEGYVFSAAGADGARVFPWGGGRTMCPGRLFAKQEVLSAVALMLLTFDIVPVDEKAYRVPDLAPSPPGSGGMLPGGDVKVWLKPRTLAQG